MSGTRHLALQFRGLITGSRPQQHRAVAQPVGRAGCREPRPPGGGCHALSARARRRARAACRGCRAAGGCQGRLQGRGGVEQAQRAGSDGQGRWLGCGGRRRAERRRQPQPSDKRLPSSNGRVAADSGVWPAAQTLQGSGGPAPVLSSSLMVLKKAVKARRPCATSATAHICSAGGKGLGKQARGGTSNRSGVACAPARLLPHRRPQRQPLAARARRPPPPPPPGSPRGWSAWPAGARRCPRCARPAPRPGWARWWSRRPCRSAPQTQQWARRRGGTPPCRGWGCLGR